MRIRKIRKKVLGRTGIELPIIGIGAANLGLPSQASAYEQHVDNSEHKIFMDREVGVQTLRTAVLNGCGLIDTAPKYGYQESEKIIGLAIKKYPFIGRRAIITTKIGLIYGGDGFDYSYDMAMRSFEGSMKRLGLSHFPVVYLHDPMGFPMKFVMSKKGVVGALQELQRQGVIDFLGVAADEPETAADYIDTGVFDVATVSGAWSLVNRTAEKRILPAVERHNVGIIITTAIERGLLVTGIPEPHVKYIQRNFSSELLANVNRIKKLCDEFGISLLAVALQYAVRDSRITACIPGARTPCESRMNMRAGAEKIPDEFWNKLEPMLKHFDCRI